MGKCHAGQNQQRYSITFSFDFVVYIHFSRPGVRVSAHFGNFFIRSTDLLALPTVDADKVNLFQFMTCENDLDRLKKLC